MMEQHASTGRHPAAVASMAIAGLAVAALALVTIAYLVGWIPMHGVLPPGPGSIATPGQQLAGTVQGGVDLLPGETLVAPAESPRVEVPKADAPRVAPAPVEAPRPTTPQYTKHAKPTPLAPPPRPAPSFERSTRDYCVNCGTIASIGSAGGDWEVRVRFEDGSTETLRYADRPRFRIGERVHLEDGRLIPE